MIHITQGHQKGIGLEVLFKSLVFFNQNSIDKMILYCNKEDVEATLNSLPYNYKLSIDSLYLHGKTLRCIFINGEDLISTDSLIAALKVIKKDDILFTLPTSKDQLILNGEIKHGYTEFFRSYFDKKEIAMIFTSENDYVALLSDHIPITLIPSELTYEFIQEKTELIIDSFHQYLNKLDNILMTGINPHSGEDGRLGTEDKKIEKVLSYLNKKYQSITFNKKPIPADTVQYHRKNNLRQLIIYSAHDQALTTFKDRNGILGANVSLGLPFLRLSVDHGTAFELYQQNAADSTGCFYCLKQALLWNNRK